MRENLSREIRHLHHRNHHRYLPSLGVLGVCTLVACAKPLEVAQPIDDRYIVVLKTTPIQTALSQSSDGISRSAAVHQVLSDLESVHAMPTSDRVFSSAVQGGVYHLTPEQVLTLSKDPNVAYVEKDQVIKINAEQVSPPWGLDRIDQTARPLDHSYHSPDSGAVVNAYIIDTGISSSHQEFQGRVGEGTDLVDHDANPSDCNGHGTHVAGTIGGTTFGVAKTVLLHGVRVLDCNGSGSTSDVIAGIEWVTAHHLKPAVANMSLGGGASQAIDEAVAASIQAGVTYVVAAGNESANACNSSPARAPTAITVGSTTSEDSRSSFSNFGACVDVFAPGSDILSAWYTSATATNTISGTSMASPHVAGVAALFLAQHPTALPAEVASEIKTNATPSKVTNAGSGSPNLLVNTLFLLDGEGGGGGGGGGEEPSPRLENGVARSALSASRDEENRYVLEVPAGASRLTVQIAGGTGDADLYLKFGEAPSLTSFDCRPFIGGNNESCVVDVPTSGKYHVLLKAFSNYANITLLAQFLTSPPPPTDPCTDCSKSFGQLDRKGDFDYQPDGREFQSPTGLQNHWLVGPASSDFDIYLYKLNGTIWTQVASSLKTDSKEQISYPGESGTYRLKVISYSGTGTYNVWQSLPK